MYSTRNKTYSTAGYILKHKNTICYDILNENILEDLSEIPIDINNISISNKNIIIDNIIYLNNQKNWDYSSWKDKLVKLRYTPEDQIAIILNKDFSDEDKFLFDRMQEWREWSGRLAKKILEKNI